MILAMATVWNISQLLRTRFICVVLMSRDPLPAATVPICLIISPVSFIKIRSSSDSSSKPSRDLMPSPDSIASFITISRGRDVSSFLYCPSKSLRAFAWSDCSEYMYQSGGR